ncbi:MAG: ABC transporter permease subunit [Enterocloster clostridioformis]
MPLEACWKRGGRVLLTAPWGTDYAMDAIAACVVGGISMKGGIGTLPGVVVGVIIFQIISYGLIYVGVSPDLRYVVKGMIIIVAVVLDNRKTMRKAA